MFGVQKTISNAVGGFGIGLHSGENTSIRLLPAPEDTGIIFRRTDVEDQNKSIIKACYKSVSETTLCTTISNEYGVKVCTVEHLLAALWGCKVDNIIIELNKPEIPIMDGSAEPFVFLIECAGIKYQNKPRKIIEILKKVTVSSNDAYASISPADNFSVSMNIEFEDNLIAKQTSSFDINKLSFKMDLARARTFGFANEVEYLKSIGLARGASLANAVGIENGYILNKEGLRYKDEFVRHKILDSIGDLYLSGAMIKGRFDGFKSGHRLNNLLLHKLFSDDQAWRFSSQFEQNSICYEEAA